MGLTGEYLRNRCYLRINPEEILPPINPDPIPEPLKRNLDSDFYCIVYNDDLLMTFQGVCNSGRPWNGNVYVYNGDGILIQKQIWKDGIFFANTRL